MSVLSTGLAKTSAGGYDIDNSLRFNDDDSAYLSRTPSSAGNRKTWTFSCWVKRGNIDTEQSIFSAGTSGSSFLLLKFQPDNTIRVQNETGGGVKGEFVTSQLFRDPSAWYHLVLVHDSTQGTASNRLKFYVNGSQVTAFSSTADVPSSFDGVVNSNVAHSLGVRAYTGSNYIDGYLAEVNFVDGQALTPADFGETDATYGHWKPIEYAGTYGTNGFYLDFKTSGSLGNDANGSNNWTVNNLAATDQMVDTPTNNFATGNPLAKAGSATATFSEGNLKLAVVDNSNPRGSFVMSSGKWYWEGYLVSGNSYANIGIAESGYDSGNLFDTSSNAKGYMYLNDGNKRSSLAGTATSYGSSYTNGDIIGVAYDADNGTVAFYKNNTTQNNAYTGLSGGHTAYSQGYGGTATWVINFGQDSSFAGNKTAQGNADGNGYGDFYYTPPTGYLALCTQNLPEPTVVPSEHFNTVLYTGNGVARSITGMGFAPDWNWIKKRSAAEHHALYDIVRGVGKRLESSSTAAEDAESGGHSSFDADGFSISGANDRVNTNGQTYVAWNWKANGAGVSNTDGSITSTVSANADAGFSIVSYTGSGSAATVGHGLSVAPEMIIVKTRNDVEDWGVYHASNTAAPETDRLKLNSTVATADNAGFWNDVAPTSSLFTVGTANTTNWSTKTYIAYCFHSVDGYSKVGSYTGNGSTDGTFVYTGFRPAYVMFKCSSNPSEWKIIDDARNPHNVMDLELRADSSQAESQYSGHYMDFLSNGVKFRATDHPNQAKTYIYLAFAENPFKYTNAR